MRTEIDHDTACVTGIQSNLIATDYLKKWNRLSSKPGGLKNRWSWELVWLTSWTCTYYQLYNHFIHFQKHSSWKLEGGSVNNIRLYDAVLATQCFIIHWLCIGANKMGQAGKIITQRIVLDVFIRWNTSHGRLSKPSTELRIPRPTGIVGRTSF